MIDPWHGAFFRNPVCRVGTEDAQTLLEGPPTGSAWLCAIARQRNQQSQDHQAETKKLPNTEKP